MSTGIERGISRFTVMSPTFVSSISVALRGYARRRPFRTWRHRAAVVLVTAALVASATPASAVDYERTQYPVVGGTALQMRGGYCTAGFVVKKDGFLANLSAASRATRYVVTAKHCGPVGTDVSVGGQYLGKVVWTSQISDLGMIEVAPNVRRIPHCSSRSTGISCIVITSYDPRAVGRVLLASLRTRSISTVPVTGFGDGAPSGDTDVCTSGATTGLSCLWTAHELTTEQVKYAGEHGATTSGTGLLGGDSGCPVVSTSGLLYGVHSAVFRSDPSLMTYISAGQFFLERPGYSLAPS
ncbi:hypothetical protein ACR8AM_05655 [Clavibacter sepedonicus]|uniref:hypothetical protein n=1 Tax=Clavibacter TaxID=1573 RepID=UPI0010552ACD|nr:hypothetical protein [Clavibacter sp.]MBD5382254.1 S1 family peptidase [Clavibacter sp.]UUK65574.1 S1 family peptidase [Clavibacter sepedonicus]